MDKQPLNAERICRTCLVEADSLSSIFTDDSKLNCSFATMVSDCSAMKVNENDGLPDKICSKCAESARSAFVFRRQCNSSYETLCTVLAPEQFSLTPQKRPRGRPRKQPASTVVAAAKEEQREELTVQVECLPELTQDGDSSEEISVDCKMEVFEGVEYLADSFDDVVKQIKNEPSMESDANRLDEDSADDAVGMSTRGSGRHACKHCDRVFSRGTHLRRHLLTHSKMRPFPCRFCPKLFARSDAVAKHELTHSEAGVRKSPSHEAEPMLFFDADFANDFGAADNDDDDELIVEISEAAQAEEQLEEQNAEEKEMPGKFACQYCDKTFGRTTHLRRHILTHTKEKQYQCTVCSKAFARSDHLAKHESQHSGERPFKCELCDKSFKRAEHLRNHIESKHSDKEPTKKTEICDICQKGFTTPQTLKNHRKSHFEAKVLNCKHCDAQFTDRELYREHTKQEHTNPKGFLCSECGQSFVRNDYLLVHMRRHNGIKPYRCKFCPKAFPRATDLNVHEKYHTNEKTHLCTICGKGFHRHYNLVVHSRTHNGLKPYKCPHCPKSFAQGNDLKAHIRRHTGERYKCDICDQGFIQFYQLTNHRRSVHNIDPAKLGRRVTKYVTPTAQEQQVLLQQHQQQLVSLQQQQKELEQQQQQGWDFEHMGRDPDLEKRILEIKERIHDAEREIEEINNRIQEELGRHQEAPEDQEGTSYPHPSYGQQFLNDPSALPSAFADSVVKTEKPQGH
ncbi:zinc finger protein 431-like [Culex pipiens pallens]|uniref:zinc finger protein 431-like n=1 Tax=Culex pipiens pallens TaxID=42434 RepID=UPI0019537681|nr:zinc finger protein 431-like [Culex pipiens pallens]